MISIDLARQLRDAGVAWHPSTGDRFTLLEPSMTGEVFTISDMMIEAHEFSTGTVLGFNGTTEWALDSVAAEDALWLPHEEQLRGMLGGTFLSLSVHDPDGFAVLMRPPGEEDAVAFAGATAADAYATAVLALVEQAMDPSLV
ncbi:pilus assembly protein CpaE [Cellulomonas sp. ATA003]|uniref:pilus assembly protein CpaE n=1 Tax=Cellulomonas sp. ATA003 TaxID=3073064 RepID=UPI002873D6B7|nr:pilus assembly protein CpaE [Cellulomonas sp. ATA003]WNB84782.1 pilus assembly protein CpaE [Cellulomonas sp. ATA003]